MARYALNLPADLKHEAEVCASSQGVSLNQFILWAVAERVAALRQGLDDPRFPRVSYRRAAAGQPVPVLTRTGVRIKTLVVARNAWTLTEQEIATEFGLTAAEVKEALRFYVEHQQEIESLIDAEAQVDAKVS